MIGERKRKGERRREKESKKGSRFTHTKKIGGVVLLCSKLDQTIKRERGVHIRPRKRSWWEKSHAPVSQLYGTAGKIPEGGLTGKGNRSEATRERQSDSNREKGDQHKKGSKHSTRKRVRSELPRKKEIVKRG